MNNILGTILLVVVTFSAHAATKTVTGTIEKVQLMSKNYASYNVNGEAIAFIHMNELPVSCGNAGGFRRVAITSNHPAFNVVVSTALAAKTAQQTVELRYVEECTLWNNNAWDFSIITTQ